MKHVAVLGGGPAGAVAAERLAAAGVRVTIIDEKLAWEKPCGGGITYKAYSRYPFLIDNATPKNSISETCLSDSGGAAATMRLSQPLLIYSRMDLNRMLLARAERSGAEISKDRVLAVKREGERWRVQTKAGKLDADFCVVATGARNSLRDFGTEYSASHTMYALGYYVPRMQRHIDIRFFQFLEGYIWIFPRCDHLSVGICGKGEPAHMLRRRLERFMEERGLPVKGSTFFGHMIPALEKPSWPRNRVAGTGWMAAGDAAGLVDPVTGEGLYYAVRSGDLASRILLDETVSPAQRESAYRAALKQDFLEELSFGSGLAKRFFFKRFLFSSVPARMIEFMQRSPRLSEIVQDLFAGTQSYLELKKRLLDNLNGTLFDIFVGSTLGRMVVKEGR